jgi:serine/threonine-protein kinase
VADEALVVSDDFKVGAQIAGYVLREQVGAGAVAAVYRAYDVRLDRWVALKILAPRIARGDPFRQRLIRESRAAAAIGHPHIIPVFEAGEAGGVLFVAMRYAGGGDAGTLIRRLGPLDPARVARIIAQVASALDAAHAAGLVHGDVRPASMLLAAAAADSPSPDHVYLSDFGLSGRQVDDRGDLDALARAAYEMLTGQRPPSGREGDAGSGPARPAESPPSLNLLRPDLPPEIDYVLARALAGSPGDRYQVCREFAADLLEACGLERDASEQPPADPPEAAAPHVEPGVAASRAEPLVAAPRAEPRVAAPHVEPGVVASRAEPRVAPGVAPAGPSLQSARLMATGLAGAEIALARRRLAAYESYAPEPNTPEPNTPEPALPEPYSAEPPAPEPYSLAPYSLAPYSPAPPRRSPVIAAAILVVILAVAGAIFLALRGGAAPSPHAGIRPAASGPVNSGNPGSSANGRHASHVGQSSHSGPGSYRKRISHVKPAGHVRPSSTSSPGKATNPANSAGPAMTVSAYIAAINARDYARAWSLGGRSSSPSYAAFVQGFASTASDTLTILSVNGHTVTVRLAARQTDGAVITYQGTYTVDDGVIVASDVKQIG